MATPGPTPVRATFGQAPPPLQGVYMPSPHPQMHPKVRSLSNMPYLAYPSANPSLDLLQLSRTVLLRNLNPSLSLNRLLSEISWGAIEYCKMFEVPAPAHLDGLATVKHCHISFVNASSALSFCRKYNKNLPALRTLQERLDHSDHLKVSLNELRHAPHGTPNLALGGLAKQDFFKVKTLNYINEFNATRAVLIKFELASWDFVTSSKEEVRALCSKYGEIEDFKISKNEKKCEVKFLIHFTSIDSAIKIYEYHIKLMQNENEKSFDQSPQYSPQIMCKYINFHRDRCDRPEHSRSRQSSTTTKINSLSPEPSAVSSPVPSHKKSFNSLCAPVSEVTELDLSTTSIETENLDHDATKSGAIDYSIASDLNSHRILEDYDPNGYAESVSSASGETPRPAPRMRRPIARSESYLLSQSFQYPSGYPVSQPMFPFQFNSDHLNAGNRTLYLGNLHPNTQVEEIANNVRAGGLVESLKYYKNKRICFITFIDPAVALNFHMTHQILHQLIIHGSEVNVGWGKNHSGPLNRDIALAVTAGASRNVFIGLKLATNPEHENKVLPLPSESKLRSDFGKFGDLEQINFYHNNNCGFMNFMNIVDAIKVVELFENSNVDQINQIAGDNGEFYERYRHYKISFGKDRCGNPPKFNYKKKMSPVDGREEVTPPPITSAISSRETVNSINEETAMVFGISTEDPGEHHTSFGSNQGVLEDKNELSGFTQPHETGFSPGNLGNPVASVGSSDDEVLTATNESHNKVIDEDNLNHENADSHKSPLGFSNDEEENGEVRVNVKTDNPVIHHDVSGNEENGQEDNGEDDDDNDKEEEEDDDEDISIIIGSDVTTPSQKRRSKKYYRKHDRVYNHRFGLNDGFGFEWNLTFNSTLSLSSNYGYPRQYPGVYGMGYPGALYYPQETSFFPQSHQMPYYGISQQTVPMGPMYNQDSFSTSTLANKGSYLTSGSLVMAQYLAKYQQDNYIYASNILNNEGSVEDVKEYKGHGKRNSRKSST